MTNEALLLQVGRGLGAEWREREGVCLPGCLHLSLLEPRNRNKSSFTVPDAEEVGLRKCHE